MSIHEFNFSEDHLVLCSGYDGCNPCLVQLFPPVYCILRGGEALTAASFMAADYKAALEAATSLRKNAVSEGSVRQAAHTFGGYMERTAVLKAQKLEQFLHRFLLFSIGQSRIFLGELSS